MLRRETPRNDESVAAVRIERLNQNKNRLTSYEKEVADTSSRVAAFNNRVAMLNEKQASPEEKNLTASKEKTIPDKPSPVRPVLLRSVKEM